MAVESEICLFAEVSVFTMGKLRSYPFVLMSQGDLNSETKEGVRITNRVRMTETNGNRAFSTATKIRFPRKEGSSTSVCQEVELDITIEEFDIIMGACQSRYVKRRYKIPLTDGLVCEIDQYMESNGSSYDLSRFIKIDIEGGDDSKITSYLTQLEEAGIHISRMITPPGVESPEIKKEINYLMSERFNLKEI